MRQVYCQLRPSTENPAHTLVRLILPIGPDDSLPNIKSAWGQIYPGIQRAINVAKADPEVAMHLPEDLPPSLGFQLSIDTRFIEDADVDLYKLLSPAIRQVVAEAIADREQEKRESSAIWTPG